MTYFCCIADWGCSSKAPITSQPLRPWVQCSRRNRSRCKAESIHTKWSGRLRHSRIQFQGLGISARQNLSPQSIHQGWVQCSRRDRSRCKAESIYTKWSGRLRHSRIQFHDLGINARQNLSPIHQGWVQCSRRDRPRCKAESIHTKWSGRLYHGRIQFHGLGINARQNLSPVNPSGLGSVSQENNQDAKKTWGGEATWMSRGGIRLVQKFM